MSRFHYYRAIIAAYSLSTDQGHGLQQKTELGLLIAIRQNLDKSQPYGVNDRDMSILANSSKRESQGEEQLYPLTDMLTSSAAHRLFDEQRPGALSTR